MSATSLPPNLPNRTRILFGAGAVRRLGEVVGECDGKRVLLVTDRHLVAAGHAGLAAQLLRAAGMETATFSEVHENPTTLDVDACVAVARAHGAEILVGLGGGSPLDVAKGCNFLLTNGGRMADYWGVGKASRAMLPFIAIPTTAGTGSEMQSAALIAEVESHQKMACLDPKAAARVAILDPELTLTQPPRVTACTGLDAVSHALEAAVTRRRNADSARFAREAFARLWPALPRVLARPDDLEARGAMLLGAALAGLAVEHSMLGAAHALANPLTAHFDLVHGHAVALALPAVVRFNATDPEVAAFYRELGHSAEALAGGIEERLRLGNLTGRLGDCGVPRDQLPNLASEAARQWTAQFNPRPVAAPDLLGLYEAIW